MRPTMVFYLGNEAIRFLEVSETGRKILRVETIPAEGMEELQLIESLKGLVRKHNLKFSQVTVFLALPRGRAILRQMNLPSHQEDELRSMAGLQAAGHIPYAREDVEIDFQVLCRKEDGYSQIMAAIAPTEMVMKWHRIFAAANIPVSSITISSVGLWLLCIRQGLMPDELAAIVDVDEDHAEICFAYAGFWTASREIPGGLRQMQQEGIEEFFRQWDLTLANLAGEGVADPVKRVLLTGLHEREPSLKEEFARRLESQPQDVPVQQNGHPLLPPGSWAAAMGIARHTAAVPINLVPQEVRRSQQRQANRRELTELLIWSGIAFVMLTLALSIGVIKQNFHLSRLKRQYHAIQKEAHEVERQIEQMRQVAGLVQGRPLFTQWLRALYEAMPPQVSLININLSNERTLTLQGISTNPADVSRFQEGLINSPLFFKVNLDYVNKRIVLNGEVNYFKITCMLKAADGNANAGAQ